MAASKQTMKIKPAIRVEAEKKYLYNRVSFFSDLYLAKNANPSEPEKTRILPLIIVKQAASANRKRLASRIYPHFHRKNPQTFSRHSPRERQDRL